MIARLPVELPDLDKLLIALRDGGTKTAKGQTRRAWSPRSLNAAIDAWRLMLAYGCDRRDLSHNVAASAQFAPVRVQHIVLELEAQFDRSPRQHANRPQAT